MKKIAVTFAALLLAAPALADSGAGRSITGDNNPSGAGRTLADSIVDPYWPKPNSGASRLLAEQIMGAPNSGAGRSMTGDNNPSGAGRTLADSIVDPYWPKPNSGASRLLG